MAITADKWKQLLNRESSEWKDICVNTMKTVNPYCSFAFKDSDKKLKKPGSRKKSGASFKCTGYCKFNGCPMKFKIEGYDRHVKVLMKDGLVKHIKGQNKSRQISGSKRLSLARALKFNSPSSMYHASFNKLSVSELCAGNRDKIGSSPEVYRKQDVFREHS